MPRLSLLAISPLERRLRLAVGAILLIAITGICWWLVGHCEILIHEASRRNATALMDSAVLKYHFVKNTQGDTPSSNEFTSQWAEAIENQRYRFKFIRPRGNGPGAPEDDFEWRVLHDFSNAPASAVAQTPAMIEFMDRDLPEKNEYQYYQPIRAKTPCINCHLALGSLGGVELKELKVGDLTAVGNIILPDADIQRELDRNRASLLAAAIVVTFLALCVAFVSIRLVLRSGSNQPDPTEGRPSSP